MVGNRVDKTLRKAFRLLLHLRCCSERIEVLLLKYLCVMFRRG